MSVQALTREQQELHSGARRELPDALEAEQALIGAILIRNNLIDELRWNFDLSHMSEDIHRRMLEAMMTLKDEGKSFSPITLKNKLPPVKIGDMTVSQYMSRMMSEAVNFDIKHWCELITGSAARREAFSLGADLQEIAFSDESKFLDNLDELRGRFNETRQMLEQEASSFSLSDAIDMSFDATSDAMQGRAAVGIHPGVPEVFQLTGPWQKGQLIIIGGGVKQGKGQPLDAKVLTPFGFRRMGDIKLGSQVTAPDGSVAKVIGVFPLGNRQIFDVKFHDGTVTEVTEDHLWLARRSQRTTKKNGAEVKGEESQKIYTTAQMIKLMGSNKKSRFQIPITKPVPFTSGRPADRPVHPYVLGVLLGDGCLKHSTPDFTCGDVEIADRVEGCLGSPISRCQVEKNAPVYRIIGRPDVRSYLKRAKLDGKGSHEKFIPPQYMYASVEDRLELVRGLMDTDGWAGTGSQDAAAFFCSTSERLANDLAWVLRSLGAVINIHAKRRFYSHQGEKKEGKICFTLRIKHPDCSELFTLERKKAKCAAPRSMTKTIVSITPGRMAESQCIQVDHPSSLYITNDFIVTHNTALAMQCMFEIAKKHAVFLFSGEMTVNQLIMREKARRTGIPATQQQNGKVSELEVQELLQAGRDIKLSKHIEIDCRKLTLDQFGRKARAMKKEHNIGIAFADHLTKFQFTGKLQYEDEHKRAYFATSFLKDLAMDLEIPIVALTHLKKNAFGDYQGRSIEDRLKAVPHRRPNYQDLLGNMDKDADQVLIPFQPRPILAGMEPEEETPAYFVWQDLMAKWENKAEIILSLSRESIFPRRREIDWNGKATAYGPPYKQAENKRELFE